MASIKSSFAESQRSCSRGSLATAASICKASLFDGHLWQSSLHLLHLQSAFKVVFFWLAGRQTHCLQWIQCRVRAHFHPSCNATFFLCSFVAFNKTVMEFLLSLFILFYLTWCVDGTCPPNINLLQAMPNIICHLDVELLKQTTKVRTHPQTIDTNSNRNLIVQRLTGRACLVLWSNPRDSVVEWFINQHVAAVSDLKQSF